jgi:transposase
MKFESVLDRWKRRELSQVEAAELLGIGERSFRRWHERYEEAGQAGLADRRLGKASAKRVPVDEAMRVKELYRERYEGFTAKHFHEHLVKDHGFRWGYTWTKTFLHTQRLLAPAPRKGAHRRKRPRRPLPGMMLHQDGSRHAWLPGCEASFDLIVTMDDATSAIYSAFLVEEEGTQSSFQGLHEVIQAHGLFCSLYTDRGSHYAYTPLAGQPADEGRLTQVGRALDQLQIEHILAYSPEARGRSERMFGTLQDRLPKELRLAGIATLEAANRFLAESYLPAHNARFTVPAEQPGSAFLARRDADFGDVLCIHEERVVGNDNTVRYRGLSLQLPPSPLRPHFVKAKVRVHDYPDGTLAVFHGPRCLARYTAAGALIDHAQARAA